ncbi:MAG: hypothetical protein AB1744_12530 [Candidatus Zixiibacteriota bacterium]
MEHAYMGEVLSAMGEIVNLDLAERDVRLAVLGSLAGTLGFKSMYDLAVTAEVPKDRLYRSVEAFNQGRYLRALRRHGRRQLVRHLKRIKGMSASTRSRNWVTLAGDDFTSRRRGNLDGMTYFWWNGGQKRVTLGLNIQVLAAILGDGDDVLILDVRLVVPPHDGPGAPPSKKTDWMAAAIDRLGRDLQREGLDFSDCVGSVDQAYIGPSLRATLEKHHLPLVSTLPLQRRVEGTLVPGVVVNARGHDWHRWWVKLNEDSLRPMQGEEGVTYIRTTVDVPSIGQVVMINIRKDGDDAVIFTTGLSMKAVTALRVARRRWHLERVFWNLQQNLGIGGVRHTAGPKVLARVYFLMLLHSAIRRVAKRHRLSIGDLCKVLHRHRLAIIAELRSGSAFSCGNLPRPVPPEGLAA